MQLEHCNAFYKNKITSNGFIKGLYNKESYVSVWKLFNWTNPEVCKEECDILIKPNDLMFGCNPVMDYTIHVYDNNGTPLFSKKAKSYCEKFH